MTEACKLDRNANALYAKEDAVISMLLELGIPDNLKGYAYIKEAVLLAYEHEELIGKLHKGLYVQIAQAHGTSSTRVERCIRGAIERGYDDSYDESVYGRYFGNTISRSKCKPTNGLFIARLANVLRSRMKEAAQ